MSTFVCSLGDLELSNFFANTLRIPGLPRDIDFNADESVAFDMNFFIQSLISFLTWTVGPNDPLSINQEDTLKAMFFIYFCLFSFIHRKHLDWMMFATIFEVMLPKRWLIIFKCFPLPHIPLSVSVTMTIKRKKNCNGCAGRF